MKPGNIGSSGHALCIQPEYDGHMAAFARGSVNGHMPVKDLGAVDDIDDTDPIPLFPGIEPFSVIVDLEVQDLFVLPDGNMDPGSPGMFQYIVQLLLYDAENGHFQLIVQQLLRRQGKIEPDPQIVRQSPDILTTRSSTESCNPISR